MKSGTFVSMSPKVAKIGMVEDVGVVGVDVEVVENSIAEDTEAAAVTMTIEVIAVDIMIVEEVMTMVVSDEPPISASFGIVKGF